MAALEALPPVAAARPAVDGRPRVLLLTEGTYPYALGGVSSWCDLLVRAMPEFEWLVLPIVAPHGRPPLYALPPWAREVGDRGGSRSCRAAAAAAADLAARRARPRAARLGATRTLVAAWVRWRDPPGVRRASTAGRLGRYRRPRAVLASACPRREPPAPTSSRPRS
jgi:hypothetical protein